MAGDDTEADEGKGDDQPMGPAEQREEGEDAQREGYGADEEGEEVQHRDTMRREPHR